MVLATQNPVDLDYKGLSNTGTWFIGRLQTERDKARVLEALASASGETGTHLDARLSDVLSGLGSRVFLMHNVHEQAPLTFQTRWTLSYLRGPLTRAEIKRLAAAQPDPGETSAAVAAAGPVADAASPETGAPPAVARASAATPDTASAAAPVLGPGITALFVPPRGHAGDSTALSYAPAVYASGSVRIADAKRRIAETLPITVLVPLQGGAIPLGLDRAVTLDVPAEDLEAAPRGPALYADMPPAAITPRSVDGWRKAIATWLYDTQSLTLLEHAPSRLHSQPGESEGAFRARLADVRREARDAKVDAIRKKFASKLQTQQDRIRRAEQQLGKQQEDVTASTGSAILTAATGVFGALFGRKTFSATNAGRLGSAARGAGRVMKEKQDVARAEETLTAERQKLQDLQTAVEAEIAGAATTDEAPLQPLVLRPKKADITLETVALVWAPDPGAS